MSTEPTTAPDKDIPPSPFKMQHDYVLVQRVQDKKSLIARPDGADDGKSHSMVIDVGPGRMTEYGKMQVPTVKRGDIVMVNDQQCRSFKLHGHEYAIVPMFQIFGVLDPTVEAWLESNAITHILTKNSKING